MNFELGTSCKLAPAGELKEHYSKVFKEAGLNNITFIETSYNG